MFRYPPWLLWVDCALGAGQFAAAWRVAPYSAGLAMALWVWGCVTVGLVVLRLWRRSR
jgi:hypothetical protein